MRQRPWVAALLLVAGALALVYNVKVYSELFAPPKSSSGPADSVQITGDSNGAEPRGETEAAQLAPLAQAKLDVFLAALPAAQRDPFRFASEQQTQQATASSDAPRLPTVEGVLIGEGRRVAFIDGRARSEGEEVNGHRIVRIEAQRVVLLSEGREIAVTPAH